jgi:hypothetical protein
MESHTQECDHHRVSGRVIWETGDLPLSDLAVFALREGRRPRAIYTAHKWFARRLGSVFRALLVSATCSSRKGFWEAYCGGADLRSTIWPELVSVEASDGNGGVGTRCIRHWDCSINTGFRICALRQPCPSDRSHNPGCEVCRSA